MNATARSSISANTFRAPKASAFKRLAALLVLPLGLHGQSVTNGDFSGNDPLAGNFLDCTALPSSAPAGWQNGGEVTNNTGPTQKFLELFDGLEAAGTNPTTPGGQGDTAVDLNDHYLVQTVSGLTPGTPYLVEASFACLRNGSADLASGLCEVFDGAGTTTPLASGSSGKLKGQAVRRVQVGFIPTGTQATLRFSTLLTTVGIWGVGLDDVTLSALSSPLVTIAAASQDSVLEGGSAGFTLTSIPAPSGGNITVNVAYSGTASDGSDFTGLASVDILDGNSTAALDLSTVDDGLLEGAENILVTIDSLSGVTATIGNDNSATRWLVDTNSAPVDGVALNQTATDAGSPVALADIVLADEAGGTSRITGGATKVAFASSGATNSTVFGDGFNGSGTGSGTGNGSQSGFQIQPDPADPLGFSLELIFTPRAADVAGGGNFRSLWEIGGTSNGTGIYMINGVPHFVSKMNSNQAGAAASLNDTDWAGNAVCVPLSASALTANRRNSLALRFTLSGLQYSLDGSGPTTVALSNVAALLNWNGTPDVDFGAIDPTTGHRGGLSTTAGNFLTDSYQAMADGTAAVTSCRFWNATDGTITATPGSAETLTATITIRNWTSDAVEGSLTAASGNGEGYASGTWTGPATTLSALNAALAAMEFVRGSAPWAVLDVAIDDQTSTGSTTGTIIIADTAPTTVYVDDSFIGDRGADVTDGDLGTGGNQAAIFGYNAFRTLAEAFAVVDPAGTVIVNPGDYSSQTATMSGNVTLRLTAGAVAIGSLGTGTGNSIDLQSHTLTLGNDGGTNFIDCPIIGTGGLTKVGINRVSLRVASTYSGTTTVNAGSLRVGSLDNVDPTPDLIGSIASPVVVEAGAVFEFNSVLGLTVTHSTPISGDGSVATFGDGTVVLTGPANTFTGGFDLGDGGSSTFDGTNGAREGFVVISAAGQLGNGPIRSRGSQLRASVPGVNVTQDITILQGGMRLGGPAADVNFHDFELSGTVVPQGGLRGIGSYGLDGRTFTLSGTLDLSGSGSTHSVTFDASEGQNNGDFIVTGNVTGGGNLGTHGSFDGAVVTLDGTNDYAGTTTLDGSATMLLDGTHTGGGAYTVTSSATLGGSGGTESSVTVNGNGTLAPGTGVGSLAIGSGVNFGDNSIFELEIDSSGPSADLLDADFLVTIGTGVSLVASDIAGSPVVLTVGTRLKIIDYYDDAFTFNGSLTGEFAGLANGGTVTIGANQFTINYQDDLRDGAGAPGTDGVADSVTLTAAGASSAYESWLAANGYSLSGGFDDDDDVDGVSNGEEWYFHNSNPLVPQGSGAPLGSIVQTAPGTITFTHRRPVNRTGVDDDYEWSVTLATWFDDGASNGTLTVAFSETGSVPDPMDGDYEFVTLTATASPGAVARLFARLALNPTP